MRADDSARSAPGRTPPRSTSDDRGLDSRGMDGRSPWSSTKPVVIHGSSWRPDSPGGDGRALRSDSRPGHDADHAARAARAAMAAEIGRIGLVHRARPRPSHGRDRPAVDSRSELCRSRSLLPRRRMDQAGRSGSPGEAPSGPAVATARPPVRDVDYAERAHSCRAGGIDRPHRHGPGREITGPRPTRPPARRQSGTSASSASSSSGSPPGPVWARSARAGPPSGSWVQHTTVQPRPGSPSRATRPVFGSQCSPA